MTISECRKRRHLCYETIYLLFARLGIEYVFRFAVKSRESAHHGDEHAHRVRVIMKPVHQLLYIFMYKSVVRDVPLPVRELRAGRKLSVKQQISGFKICAPLGELFYGVAAIALYPDHSGIEKLMKVMALLQDAVFIKAGS